MTKHTQNSSISAAQQINGNNPTSSKTSRTRLIVVGAICAFVVGGFTTACSAKHRGHGESKMKVVNAVFTSADSSSNGSVTRKEMNTFLSSMFRKADTDDNSRLTPKEIGTHVIEFAKQNDIQMGRRGRHEGDSTDKSSGKEKKKNRASRMGHFIAAHLDSDGDGQVSLFEFNRHANIMVRCVFELVDQDSNGAVSNQELEQAPKLFGRHHGGSSGHKPGSCYALKG